MQNCSLVKSVKLNMSDSQRECWRLAHGWLLMGPFETEVRLHTLTMPLETQPCCIDLLFLVQEAFLKLVNSPVKPPVTEQAHAARSFLLLPGIQWSHMYRAPEPGGMTFGWVCWMILFDSVLYFLCGWYFSNLVSGKKSSFLYNSNIN